MVDPRGAVQSCASLFHSPSTPPASPAPLQLNLEAEALRRQVNALRVDLTIYRSSLAFMDNPVQVGAARKLFGLSRIQ